MRATAVTILIVLTFVVPIVGSRSTCGTERWDVKTLTDIAAARINFTPTQATVEQLAVLRAPGAIALHTPRFAAEQQTYTLSARLVGFKLEKDSDIHVVIAGSSGATMIVEIPDPGCTGTRKHAEMAKARADFVTRFGQPTRKFTRVSGTSVTVSGVLFFDLLHGQTGVANNGVEIHPVLAIGP